MSAGVLSMDELVVLSWPFSSSFFPFFCTACQALVYTRGLHLISISLSLSFSLYYCYFVIIVFILLLFNLLLLESLMVLLNKLL